MNCATWEQALIRVEAAGASEQSLRALCDEAWMAYAAERWQSAKRMAAQRRFEAAVKLGYERMRAQAMRLRRRLEFSRLRLQFLAVKSLLDGCMFCGELFGVESLGVVFDEKPSASLSASFSLSNAIVCCALCARAKGILSGNAWLDVLAALRASDSNTARQTREALALGWGFGVGKGAKVLPGRPAAKVTRQRRLWPSDNREK